MLRRICPSCGAEIVFRSAIAVYAVCASCGSMVVRTDEAMASLGQAAALPDEASPLQVGADLQWRGLTYTILGRARLAWADGAWNEWFIDRAGGADRDGGAAGAWWLTEAQGALALSFEHAVPAALNALVPPLGLPLQIEGQTYRVSDVKQARCVGSEGELPFPAPYGRAATYIDLAGAAGGFAGLEIADDGARRFYVGSYAEFDSLAFSHLREVEGWPAPGHADDRRADPRRA